MKDCKMQLIGETIGGFKINRQISAGRFSKSFEAISGNEFRALKIAREANDLSSSSSSSSSSSCWPAPKIK